MLIADAFALRREGIVCLLSDWAIMHSVTLWPADLLGVSADPDVPLKCCLCIMSVGSLSVIEEASLEWLAHINDRFPATPWVVLSDRAEPVEALHALKQGACGFIPTSMSPDLVRQALSFILGGGTFFPPEALTIQTPGRYKRAALPGRRRLDPSSSEPHDLDTSDANQLYDALVEDSHFREMWSAMARSVIWPDFHARAVSSGISTAGDESAPASATILAFHPSSDGLVGSRRRPK